MSVKTAKQVRQYVETEQRYQQLARHHLEKLCTEYIEATLGEEPTKEMKYAWLYAFRRAYYKKKLTTIEYSYNG